MWDREDVGTEMQGLARTVEEIGDHDEAVEFAGVAVILAIVCFNVGLDVVESYPNIVLVQHANSSV